jgi:hypothetical protein
MFKNAETISSNKLAHRTLEPPSTRDWIRTMHNHVKRRMQSLCLLSGGEGKDEGERSANLSIAIDPYGDTLIAP